MDIKLTSRQRIFCLEYMVDFSATQAAIRAGYSKRSAASIGEENLRKPEIRTFLSKAMKEREKRTKVSADRVIKELSDIAFASLSDVARIENGRVIFHDEISERGHAALRDLVSEETQRGLRKRVNFHDKLKALELLAKHLNLLKPQESNHSQNMPTEEDYNAVLRAIDRSILKDALRKKQEKNLKEHGQQCSDEEQSKL